MEEAGLSVDASALGQLDHEQLDHENQFNFEAEGFDFNFDGVYDESAQFVAETTGAVEDIGLMVKDMDTAVKDMEYEVDDVGTVEVPGNNDEIGYEDEEEEIQIGGGEIQQHETLQVSRDVGFEVDTEAEVKEAVVDYQDEIGYEDDDLGAAEIRIDLKSEQATELVAGVANNQPQEHLEPIEEVHNNGAQSQPEFQIESTEVKDTSATHEELDPTTHDEHGAIDDHPAREENKNEAVFDHDGVADEDYHDESALEDYIVEDEDPSQGPSDLDKAIEDLTNSLPSIPEVEVLYNDGSYSLFGNSDDDPETFFLSGTKHIDRSLTELLSSLREVLSEEIAPTDELVISVESLGLEFGERSNQKFLARSLRELLDCHASLAAKNYGDFPAQPTLRLMVQQDCEEQFLRLLQEAEFEDESSNQSEHYAASEKQDDWPSANSLGDRQGLAGQTEQDDQAENVDSEKHSAEGDHATNVVPDVVPTVLDGEAGQVNSSMEQGFSFQETLDDPEQRSEAADTDEEHADEEMEDLAEEHAEEHTEAYMEEHIEQYADEHMEEHEEEHEEDRTEEPVEGHTEQQTEEQTKGQTEDANQTSDAQDTTGSGIAHEELHSENSPNEPSTGNHETEQHARDQNGDVFENDGAGFDEFDEYAAADTGDTEQTAGLNGNNPFLFPPTTVSLSDMNRNITRSPGNVDHKLASEVCSSKASSLQQACQEVDDLIDYSDDDYDDESAIPTSFQQVAQVPEVSDSSRVGDGEPSPSCIYETLQREPGAAVSVFKDTEMLGMDSPHRVFFTSHSRTGSNQSFNFSHTSDANVPDFEDDDLMLGYDNDAGLSTIEEQEDDEYDDITVTLNAEDDTEDHNDDSAENTGTVEGDLQHGTSGQEPRNVAHNTSEDAESIHTSTTMNGEEIDYEEQHAANDSLTPGDGLQQSAPSFGGEEDEIDWGNDGYEYNEEEEHSGVDESFASEGQKDVALTPSSLVAKRSRTDEAESLAEESDNKRRRT